MTTDAFQFLDRFCAQAAKERSDPEKLPAGREILSLPPDGQRLVVLGLFGCLEAGVADYFSQARWGTGLKHYNETWAIERLFKQLATRLLPMTDHDFYAILATKKGYPEHGASLLTLLETSLEGVNLSANLKRWLGKVRQATDDVYQAWPRGLEKDQFKAEIARIDVLMARRSPRRGKARAGEPREDAKRAIVQDLSVISQSWELKPPAPNAIVPTAITLGSHTGIEFRGLRSTAGAIYEDGEFDRCHFPGGVLSLAPENEHFDPAARCIVRRVRLTRCSVGHSLVGPAIFEDVTVDHLETRSPFFLRGAAFKHVTLKGNLGSILLRSEPSTMSVERNDRALMQANLSYYKHVDWAIDVREARAKELSIRSVPVDLVRYDPEHQAVVRLTKIRRRWAEIKKVCDGCVFAYSMGDLRTEPYCDGVILCVPLRAKKKRIAELTAVLKRLRKLGIADPA